MAGSKGTKYYDIFLDYAVSLNHREKGKILDANHFDMLKAIDRTGSLKDAATELNISYRKLWGNLQEMEEALNFKLVERQRGGTSGGKTTLTNDGLNLINAHKELRNEIDGAIHTLTKKFFKDING